MNRRILHLGPVSLLWQPRVVLVFLALVMAVLVLAMMALDTGRLPLGPGQILKAIIGSEPGDQASRVIRGVRLPRVLTAVLVGAALGMAGAVFQSISRNPLGSPDVIGFTTGAATGAIVQIVVFDAGALATALAAILSGLAAALLVLALSWQAGSRGASGSGYRLVLVGVGMGAVLSGVNAVLLVMGGLDQAAAAQVWLAGSLNARSWAHVVPLAIGFFVLAPVLLAHSRALTLIEMGEDAARPLGVPVGRVRMIAVLAAVALTALATAAAGPIAFIALAGPQLARRLSGSTGVPLASGGLMGAALLLAADLASQRFPLDLALPVGLVTGLLGGVYLLWVLLRD